MELKCERLGTTVPDGEGGGRQSSARRRILIIHQNFPGQFRHIAQRLAQRPDVEVIGLGRDTAPGLANVTWLKYKLHRPIKADTHHYLRQMEAAVLHGQAVARALNQLKRKGFVPDIILAHPGWGETLYAKEIFPQARLIHFAEWYYATEGADFNFDPEFPAELDDRLRVTSWNALHLLNMEQCDAAITPTHWQKSRFPQAYQNKLSVIHEGVPVNSLGPDPQASFTVPATAECGALTLHAGDPVITYVARNLEPYRGFHIFMRTLPEILQAHPTAHIVIVGGNERSYGSAPKDAPNWREKMLRELTHPSPGTGEGRGERAATPSGRLPENWQTRVHFLGKLPYDAYKKVLQVSAAHIYLTYPFVLSWSLLEAMATGCLVIASDTAPVREVIKDCENGLLTDFFGTNDLRERILMALREPERFVALRQCALQTARTSYRAEDGLTDYLELLGLSEDGVWP